jgi:hypothetical protein
MLICVFGRTVMGTDVPHAVVTAPTHDVGTVKQGERVDHIFNLRNDGTASLKLQLARLSLPGMTAKFEPEIAPGAEGTFHLQWDTSRIKGPFEAVASVRLNDPAQPEIQFVLRAVVQPPVEFQPFAAVFLSAFRGESTQQSIRILNHEARPLKVLGLDADSGRFTATVQTVEAGRIYELQVTSKADAPLGRAQEPLYLLTDHPERGRLRVLVNVLIKPDVYANPEEVDFGSVRIAEITGRPGLLDLLTQTFVVKARHGEMQIKAVRSDLDFLDIKQSPPLGKAGAFRIDVGLVPRLLQPGPIQGLIILATSDPSFPEVTVPVRGEIR